MRADRLVSLVLLLRQRGRMSAPAIAQELEVSTRTVLRDIEALSAAGVPVYAERGRLGGFELMPGFQTELTGLTHDEALALLVAGSRRGAQAFGLGSALAAAMLKVIDALPPTYRDAATGAASRLLIDPTVDLLSRQLTVDEAPIAAVSAVRAAVITGNQVRIKYSTATGSPRWHTLDPVGLVAVRDDGYLLATAAGQDRTFRLSRILEAEGVETPAVRAENIDLDQIWQDRSTRFRTSGEQVAVRLRLHPDRLKELVGTALHSTVSAPDGEGWLAVDATFQDARHAEWAVWQCAGQGEALAPEWLRAVMRERAATVSAAYQS